MLAIGTILRAAPDKEAPFPGYARLVYISPDDLAWLIRLDVNKIENLRTFFHVSLQDLVEWVDSGRILSDLEFDAGNPISEDQLSKKSRQKMEKNYKLIKPLLDDESLIYDPERRYRKFKKVAEDSKMSDRWIRRLYYRFYAGGMLKIAVAPEFRKCGNPGGKQPSGSARRGPKTKKGAHCNVALPDVREKLEKGARKHYLSGERTLLGAYVATLTDYYPARVKANKDLNGKEKLKEIILPDSDIPTLMQFRYVCQCLAQTEAKRKKTTGRLSEQRKPKRLRGGSARDGVNGPGARFEIDSSKLQIQLVSRYGSNILVGTPTLYLLIDVWSGAYVGYAFSLSNPGWSLAAKSLYCAFQEKDSIFKRLGLPYHSSDWPCYHLPTKLTADRAELISNKSDRLPELGIKVEITAPMRPDMKSSVEEGIKRIKHSQLKKLPGNYPKMPQRREPNGKSEAALTIDDLERILIHVIIRLNNKPVPIRNIPLKMLSDNKIPPTRIGMYSWGLLNCPGFTRTLSPKTVYTHLLSKDYAPVTPKGILFKNQIYLSDILIEKGYLAKSANGRFPIEIRYEEHLADHIWFLEDESNDWVIATVDNDDVRRDRTSFFELDSFYTHANQLHTELRMESVYRDQVNEAAIAPIISQAKIKAKIQRRGINKTEANSKIRRNRKIEIEANLAKEENHIIESNTTAITSAIAKDANLTMDDDHGQEKKSITALSEELWSNLNDQYN